MKIEKIVFNVLCVLIFMMSATLFSGVNKAWDISDAYKEKTETREKICLNGVWKINFEDGKGLFKQKKLTARQRILQSLKKNKTAIVPQKRYQHAKTWEDIRVPGPWYDSAWYSLTKDETLLNDKLSHKLKHRVSNYIKRNGKLLKNYSFSWYKRKITIPSNWNAGDIYLRFEHLSLMGWFFVNNQYIGIQDGSQAKDMRLPSVKAGQTVTLDVLISAQVGGFETIFMGGEQIAKRKKTAKLRGITGDVWLIYKKADQIQDILIKPSVRKKQLDIEVALAKGFKGSFAGSITNAANDKAVKSFVAKHTKLSSGKYLLSIPWQDPVLWNPENPHLYTLKLKAVNEQGKTLDEFYPVTFGFREFWIKGKQYYLNGNPCRLRIKQLSGHRENVSASLIDVWKKIGYNAIETSARLGDVDDILRVADRQGMMVLLVLPGVNRDVNDWHNKKTRKQWTKRMKSQLDRGKNHASVIHWVSNINLLGSPWDLHFDKIGRDYHPAANSGPGKKWKVAKESEKIIQKMDSSRPMLHHAGGNYGQVHTSNMYFNFLPLQEKDEWLSIWAEKGIKPFVAIELGMPYDASYYANRQSVTYHNCYSCEPLYAEYTARMMGPAAYRLANQHRLESFVDSPVEIGVHNGIDKYSDCANYYYGKFRRKPAKDYIANQVMLGDFIKNWRTYPVSGFNTFSTQYDLWENWQASNGKKKLYKSLKTPGGKTRFDYTPVFSKATPLLAAYKKWLSPELYYISGAEKEFTDKQHAYYAGDSVNKSIVMLNDSFSDKKIELEIKIKELKNGKTIFSKNVSEQLKPGERSFVGFTFKTPAVTAKTNCAILLYRNSKQIDSFKIEIFPKNSLPRKNARAVWVLDQSGELEHVLKQKGISFKKYQEQILTEKDLLLLGSGSLDAFKRSSKMIKESINKGLNVLVMPQKKDDLESTFALRAFIPRSRRVFMGDSNNKLFTSLAPEDLIYWNGSPKFNDSTKQRDEDVYPTILWEKGKRHVVANTVIEKPHQGAFKTWIHEGFDLLYSALLEEQLGKGKIMFCQINLFSRTQPNPASDILFANILNYLDKPLLAEKLPVYYSGGANGAKILNTIGISFTKLIKNSAIKTPGILVLSDLKLVSAAKNAMLRRLNLLPKGKTSGSDLNETAISRFLNNGGKVVVLASYDLDKFKKLLRVDVKGYKTERFAFNDKSLNGIFDSLTDADWYWKERTTIPLPVKDFPVHRIPKGQGEVIICQIDPFSFKNREIPEQQRRKRYKKLRNISVLMQYLGAAFDTSTIDYVITQQGTGPIDLTGTWKFRIDIDNKGLEKNWQKVVWNKAWKNMNVPGSWESQGENTPNPNVNGKLPYDGYAWYQKTFKIPKAYKGKTLLFDAMVIDDFDWTYFNGKLIGKIGEETPKYWAARRLYPIPGKLINYDGENTLTIRVFDRLYGGGIMKSPVQLALPGKKIFPYLDSDMDESARFNPYKFQRW